MKPRHFFPALLWLLFITGLSVMPSVQMPKFDFFSADKLVHALVYGVLTWLLLKGVRQSRGAAFSWKTSLMVLFFAIGYGVLMEFVQFAFIPGRYYEIDDMLANGVGCLLAWGVYGGWLGFKRLS